MRTRVLAVAISVVSLGLPACGGGDDGDDIGDDGDDTGPTGDSAVVVDHYDYRFDVETRAASVTVSGTAVSDGDCVLMPYRSGELLIDDTLLQTQPATSATVTDDVLRVCGAPFTAGHAILLDTAMTVPDETYGGQVGYGVYTDRWDNPFYYLVSWVNGCSLFGPCDASPSAFALYTFTVTHPAGVTIRCPGTIEEVDATTTRCEFGYDGGPSYSTFGIVGSTNWTVTDFTFGGLPVELYDHVGSGVAEGIDADYHGGFLDFMRDHFGPFPYGDELRVLTGPTYWSGFEHPGNIVLDDGLGTPPTPTGVHYTDPLAHVLNHEMAHQWAGDQTTLADTYDFVWKESMAEYLAYVYEAETDPVWAADTREYWKAAANGARYYPVPMDDPRPELFRYYGDVYGPGPLILFLQIENLSSRAEVLAALETVLGEERALSVDEVQAALEDATGLDLGAYFDAWVRGDGEPDWPRIRATYAAGELTIEQASGIAGAGCAFEVELRGAGLAQRRRVAVDTFTSGPTQSIAVEPAVDFDVIQIAIDPDNTCLVFAAPGSLARSPVWPRIQPWVSARAQ